MPEAQAREVKILLARYPDDPHLTEYNMMPIMLFSNPRLP